MISSFWMGTVFLLLLLIAGEVVGLKRVLGCIALYSISFMVLHFGALWVLKLLCR